MYLRKADPCRRLNRPLSCGLNRIHFNAFCEREAKVIMSTISCDNDQIAGRLFMITAAVILFSTGIAVIAVILKNYHKHIIDRRFL